MGKSVQTTKSQPIKTARKKRAIQAVSPQDIIQKAMQSGQDVDLDKMEKFLELQRQWEADQARKAFAEALPRAHANIPTIVKTAKNKQTNSKYAELDEIIKATTKVLSAEGFTVSFYELDGAPEGHVRVGCTVQHSAGHEKEYHYDVPLDGVGIKGNANMTAIHGKASSVSYGRRYILCMVFNIPTGDDNDGNNAPVVTIDYHKQSILLEYLDDPDMKIDSVKRASFLAWLGPYQDVSEIPETLYPKALQFLKDKKAAVSA